LLKISDLFFRMPNHLASFFAKLFNNRFFLGPNGFKFLLKAALLLLEISAPGFHIGELFSQPLDQF